MIERSTHGDRGDGRSDRLSEDAAGGQTAASVASGVEQRRTMTGRGLLTWGCVGGWAGGERESEENGGRWLDTDRDKKHAGCGP